MGKSKRIWQSEDGKDIITSNVVVYTFTMGDVDDPDLYAGSSIYDWQQSEAGKWVMENAIQKPSWHRNFDIYAYGYQYQIRADLTDEQITFFELKYK
jgi:hypothetical protein